MNTNLNSQIPSPHSLTGEGVAAAVGIMGSALLVAKRLFAAKPPKPEPMSRADFYAELVVLKDQMHANHLALLEQLDANHRELLVPWSGRLLASIRSKPGWPAWTSAPSRAALEVQQETTEETET